MMSTVFSSVFLVFKSDDNGWRLFEFSLSQHPRNDSHPIVVRLISWEAH